MPQLVLWFVGTAFILAGLVGLILTHFGLVPGFFLISPFLYAAALGCYITAIGIRWPAVALGLVAVAATFFIAVEQFNFLGLKGVI
jgi:hypothetical protein